MNASNLPQKNVLITYRNEAVSRNYKKSCQEKFEAPSNYKNFRYEFVMIFMNHHALRC